MTSHQIIQLYRDGLIDTAELHQRLEALQVRGAIENGRYCGYDYAAQCWIER